MNDLKTPQREGLVTCGMFQHEGRFFSVMLPSNTLKTALTIAHTMPGAEPIKVNAIVEFDEIQPIRVPPASRHLKAVT